MFDDEDDSKQTVEGLKRNLEPLSVEELEKYIEELKAEITRTKEDIAKKKDVFNAADTFFK